MATAFAALLSLARSLHQILDLEQLIDPLHKENIISLHGKVYFIVTFLEDYSEKHRGTHDLVGNEIRNAAHEAQDCMDSYLCSVSTTTHDDPSSSVSLDRDLEMAFERINFIWEVAMEMKKDDAAQDLLSRTFSSPVDHSSTVKVTVNKIVGFDDDLIAIKERMYEDSSELQIIPIVGMGGIGKTTLARRTYEDTLRGLYFDIYAWATLSGEYKRGDTLLELLQSFSGNKQPGDSEAQLAKQVYQNLLGRRYLIVLDDVWSTKAWDDLKMIFPDDGNGSRILLTTRLSDVAVYAGSSSTPIHQMKFLNEDQSWKLLQEKIFGQESCPLHLVELGKKVARNCRGLPLTIVVVAGVLLSSGNMMEEELWESILENITSVESTIHVHCSKILCLSYDWLPLPLKPCFLYIGVFPEDFEIDVSELIMLWVAEGFLKPSNQSKCLEDVGKGCLEDLVKRNMILVNKEGPDGKLAAVGIHDLLRKICITKAEEEGFLHHFSSTRNVCNDSIENTKRRLVAHDAETFVGLDAPPTFRVLRKQDSSVRSICVALDAPTFRGLRKQDSSVRSIFVALDAPTVRVLRKQDSSVRSILPNRGLYSTLSPKFRSLIILNSPKVTWWNLPEVISTFVNLRYISVALNRNMTCLSEFFSSLSELTNLETIIADVTYCGDLQVPYEILMMPKLRHLIMSHPCRVSDPSDIGIIHKSDLQTLDRVIDFLFTEDVIKIFVNLKKLTIAFDELGDNWDDLYLNNLSRLQNLEELQVSLFDSSHPSFIWNYAFPISLKKLTLRGVSFPWENMTMIGSLPNLQVLEIVDNDINRESKWTTIEDQFLRLKYFCSSLDDLVKWEVEKEHLPSLESLILIKVKYIDEIPSGLGEIDSLQLIELQDCHESLANSARRIQKQQHENGNVSFHVNVVKYL